VKRSIQCFSYFDLLVFMEGAMPMLNRIYSMPFHHRHDDCNFHILNSHHFHYLFDMSNNYRKLSVNEDRNFFRLVLCSTRFLVFICSNSENISFKLMRPNSSFLLLNSSFLSLLKVFEFLNFV